MKLLQLSDIIPVDILPGFSGRMIHTEYMTVVYFSVKAGSSFPLHSHPQEQISSLIRGKFELTVNGNPFLMEPGRIIVISPGEPHCGKALTDCEIIDSFSPVREDYRAMQP
jgi:quercetin dioxygenase-like cupin family protein